MPDIPVLLFVVACSKDLLVCDEASRVHHVFPDMPACLAARRAVLKEPAADGVTMAKCRYDPRVSHGGVAHPVPLDALN